MNTKQGCDWIKSQEGALVKRLMELSAINSGTGNLSGLGQMADAFSELLSPLADELELIESATAERVNLNGEQVTERYGPIISCCKRPQAPVQVLLVGHQDTVFAADHPFQSPKMLDDGRLQGPGTADMKGGILVMITALQAFEQCQSDDRLGWRVLLNADEETGSLGSAHILDAAAQEAHVGMIFEPAIANNTLSRARKGSGNFTLVGRGRSAHAGRGFEQGRNAVVLIAEAARRLAALSDVAEGVTVNIARVQGGGAFNVVPDLAVCQFNVRCRLPQQMQRLRKQMDSIVKELNGSDGLSLELHGGFTRPPKTITPANQLFMDWAVDCGRELDIPLTFADTGGCCDGNNLAAAGLPNIDTLGVVGENIHTDQEFMLIPSLTERACLSFLLLNRLAEDGDALLAKQEDGGMEAMSEAATQMKQMKKATGKATMQMKQAQKPTGKATVQMKQAQKATQQGAA